MKYACREPGGHWIEAANPALINLGEVWKFCSGYLVVGLLSSTSYKGFDTHSYDSLRRVWESTGYYNEDRDCEPSVDFADADRNMGSQKPDAD